MTWNLAVQIAQGASGLVWLAVAIVSLPAAWARLRRGRSAWSWFGFLRASQGSNEVGFIVRWYVWRSAVQVMTPAEISVWLALYLWAAVNGLGYLYTALHGAPPEAGDA